MSEFKVTTIDELREYSKGSFVKLPDFAEGQPFYAMLRRPSLLKLAESGKIPNQLLVTANKLFTCQAADQASVANEGLLKSMFEVIEVLAEASFVSPTWEEIKDAGITLTDEQLMFIFSYTQDGVKALESFRS